MKILAAALIAFILAAPSFALNLKEAAKNYDFTALDSVLEKAAAQRQEPSSSQQEPAWRQDYSAYAKEFRKEALSLFDAIENKFYYTDDEYAQVPATRAALADEEAGKNNLAVIAAAADINDDADSLAQLLAGKESLTEAEKQEILISQLYVFIKINGGDNGGGDLQMLLLKMIEDGGARQLTPAEMFKEQGTAFVKLLNNIKGLNKELSSKKEVNAQDAFNFFVKAKGLL